jgi:hypothetical protein
MQKVKPDAEDYAAVENLPAYRGASDAERYRLAQAAKLIRMVRDPMQAPQAKGSKGPAARTE